MTFVILRRHGQVHQRRSQPHIGAMHLDLTEEETTALARLLSSAIDGDRFPLSPRVQTLKTILDKLVEPQPGPEPLPTPKRYEPPRGRYRRRG
jgi:hypothetical protein